MQFLGVISDADVIKYCTSYLEERVKPDYELVSRAYNARAHAYWRAKKYQEALADFDKLVTLDSTAAEVYRDRADCEMNYGKANEAVVDYTAAIRNDPDKLGSNYRQRAIAYRSIGQVALADKDLLTAKQCDDAVLR